MPGTTSSRPTSQSRSRIVSSRLDSRNGSVGVAAVSAGNAPDSAAMRPSSGRYAISTLVAASEFSGRRSPIDQVDGIDRSPTTASTQSAPPWCGTTKYAAPVCVASTTVASSSCARRRMSSAGVAPAASSSTPRPSEYSRVSPSCSIRLSPINVRKSRRVVALSRVARRAISPSGRLRSPGPNARRIATALLTARTLASAPDDNGCSSANKGLPTALTPMESQSIICMVEWFRKGSAMLSNV